MRSIEPGWAGQHVLGQSGEMRSIEPGWAGQHRAGQNRLFQFDGLGVDLNFQKHMNRKEMNNLLNKFWTTLFFTVLVQVAFGQTKAVTEIGDTIYVYDNGTWSFELIEGMPALVNEMAFLSDEINIDTILTEFTVSAKANKEVRDKRDMFVIKYDDSVWKRVPPATLNEEAEFAFQSKASDIWCVVIAEETPIASDKLLLIAKNTMKEATGSTPEILKTELRSVNGHDLIRGVLGVEISGIAFTFDTYYFSNDSGSVQFITWTSDNVWERNQKEILKFLNGFIVN